MSAGLVALRSHDLLTAVQVRPDRFRLVVRGGLESPTSAVAGSQRSS